MPQHTIMLFVCHPKILLKIGVVFSFSWGHFNSQEKLKTVRTRVCYGIFWSGQLSCSQIWNIEKEKDKQPKKVGDRPARLNEKKS